MKKIVFFCLTSLFYTLRYSQSHQSIPDSEKLRLLIEECNCPQETINTDSVYSLFASNPFLLRKGNIMYEVEDEPIPYDTIITNLSRYNILRVLEIDYKEASYPREEYLPPAVFRKMLGTMFSPTTRLTSPIIRWNASRLGEEWITSSNNQYLRIYLHRKMAFIDRKRDQKKYKELASLFRHAAEDHIWIRMSVPVFDEEYNFAFMFFYTGRPGYSYALFHRKEGQWKHSFIGKGGQLYEDFGTYLGFYK